MKNAILMARVSSDEQAKGYSLDIQTEKLLSHCQKENITVVNVYKEDHSAKNFNRPEFKKLLQYLSKNKGKVDYLLVTSWDRFSRNVTESFAIINRLKQYGCEVRAIEQPLDLTIPENLMILSVYLSLPDIDNRRRSIKITEGVRAAKRQGRWLGKAPFGYKIERDENNKPLLVAGDKSTIVKKIFSDIANGQSQSEIRVTLKKKGIHFSRTTFSELIRNRLYISDIFVTADKHEEGYHVKGVHKGLIEESLFNKAQEQLEENLTQKKFVKAKSFKEEFLLRGIIKCGNCGGNLTGSASRSKNGIRHQYYHCNHCHKVRVRADEINSRIHSILDEIKISSPAKKIYDLMVKKLLMKDKLVIKRPADKIQQEISHRESRIRKLEDSYSDSVIDIEMLNNGLQRYRSEIKTLMQELEYNKEDHSLYHQYMRAGIDLLANIKQFYFDSDASIKRNLLCSIFPEKLFFSKEKSRTPRLNEAVRLILSTSKGFSQQKTGQLFKNLILSGEVDYTGVELPDKFSNSNWSKNFLAWLSEIQFEYSSSRVTLDYMIQEAELLRKELLSISNDVRKLMRSAAYKKLYYLLRSITGIGPLTAASLITEIGDMKRFASFYQLNSFIGLLPSEHSSGQRELKGRLTVRRHRQLRSDLIECAWTAKRTDPALSLYYSQQLKTGKEPKLIIVKIARKLLSRIRYVWLHEKPYETGVIK